jgi:hypothetical protein
MSTHEHPRVNLPIARVMFLSGIAVPALGLLGCLPPATGRSLHPDLVAAPPALRSA